MEVFVITFLLLIINVFLLNCKPSNQESDNKKLLIKQSNTVFTIGIIISIWYLLALLFIKLLKVELPSSEPDPVFLLFLCAILFSIFCGYLKCIKK